MRKTEKEGAALKELRRIPGVGPRIARDLMDLNIRSIAGLKGKNPERLYARINKVRGIRQDPCLLYVFRCAAYFASTPKPRPALLKWWVWKDARPR